VGNLLRSARVPNTVKRVVVDDLATYIPADNKEALWTPRHAHRENLKLPIVALQRIAPAVTDEPELVLRHLANDQEIGGAQLLGVLEALVATGPGSPNPPGTSSMCPGPIWPRRS
jgi:hypothetical protein